MAWWNRQREVEQSGSVLFRGTLSPRLENFAYLAEHGIEMAPRPARDDLHWSADLAHPQFGKATLLCPRNLELPTHVLFDFDPRLTPEERARAKLAGNAVWLRVPARTGNVLRDRKDLLWYLRTVMADDGLVGMDHLSQAMWSREGLDEELAHQAELDIDAIYTMHLLYDDAGGSEETEKRAVYWLHSHGLKELGFWDFDILSPSADFQESGHDALRALAFAIVEEKLSPSGPPLDLVRGEKICAVPARDCLAALQAGEHTRYRESLDESHLEGHAVICDPPASGFLARLFGRSRIRPARFFQQELPGEPLVHFTTSATNLMAKRARQTLAVFRSVTEEFRDLELPALVKLGYVVDGGGPEDREHLWFQVHGFESDFVDATLINRPYAVSALREGGRGKHALDLLTDWTIMTPFGQINPRQTRTLRFVRAHQPEMRQAIAEYRARSARTEG